MISVSGFHFLKPFLPTKSYTENRYVQACSVERALVQRQGVQGPIPLLPCSPQLPPYPTLPTLQEGHEAPLKKLWFEGAQFKIVGLTDLKLFGKIFF